MWLRIFSLRSASCLVTSTPVEGLGSRIIPNGCSMSRRRWDRPGIAGRLRAPASTIPFGGWSEADLPDGARHGGEERDPRLEGCPADAPWSRALVDHSTPAHRRGVPAHR